MSFINDNDYQVVIGEVCLVLKKVYFDIVNKYIIKTCL